MIVILLTIVFFVNLSLCHFELEPEVCAFICCLSNLQIPLPSCVPPEEALYTKWGRVSCTGSHCLVANLFYDNEVPYTGGPANYKLIHHGSDHPDPRDPCPYDVHANHPLFSGEHPMRSKRATNKKHRHRKIARFSNKIKNRRKKSIRNNRKAKSNVSLSFSPKHNRMFKQHSEYDDDYDYEGFDQDYVEEPDDSVMPLAIEAKFTMQHVYGYFEGSKSIDFSATMELTWTDSNLALCDCVRNSSYHSVTMAADDVGKWIWLPDLSNWQHKKWRYPLGFYGQHQAVIQMSPGHEAGVTVTYTTDISIESACQTNYTWWPHDRHTCYILLGSYSYTADQVTCITVEDVNTDNIKHHVGHWLMDFYKFWGNQGLYLWDGEFYGMCGFRIVLTRDPSRAMHLSTKALAAVVGVSFGSLVFPSSRPNVEGFAAERLSILAVCIIAMTYTWLWIEDMAPFDYDNFMTEYIMINYAYMTLPFIQTWTMVLWGGCCSVWCRKMIDLVFLVIVVSSYLYITKDFWVTRHVQASEDYCHSQTFGPLQI